eukprot:m.302657 g.302657  ORF g.302657 m.302657 type:complete len:269 (-) comp19581_c0_seq1:2598-3404(-)
MMATTSVPTQTVRGLLSEVDPAMLADDADMCQPLQRKTAAYRNCSERFETKDQRFQQYALLYSRRFMAMKETLKTTAIAKWTTGEHKRSPAKYVDSILEMKRGERCFVLGTVYKDMALKPCILDDIAAREEYEAPPPERSKYCSENDAVFLEDRSGRASLAGDKLPADLVVTGVMMGVLGHEAQNGDFMVEDYCFCGIRTAEPVPLPLRQDDAYVVLASGLGVSSKNEVEKCNRVNAREGCSSSCYCAIRFLTPFCPPFPSRNCLFSC